jgi:hypothetical protein
VNKQGRTSEDVKSSVRKANDAFVQLYPLWRSRNISRRTKLRIFNSNVKSVLLYECETCKVIAGLTSTLHTFVNRCLRRILNVRWPDMISNEDLWETTGEIPTGNQIKQRKWRWIGHTLRKPDGANEKQALEWNPQGRRKRGRPRQTWKRSVLEEANEAGKTWGELRGLASSRVRWRKFIEALCSYRSYKREVKVSHSRMISIPRLLTLW